MTRFGQSKLKKFGNNILSSNGFVEAYTVSGIVGYQYTNPFSALGWENKATRSVGRLSKSAGDVIYPRL